MIRKAVLPVAGMGTRMLPATKVLAKEMLPLFDRPLIQNAVEEAREAGIEEFIFVSSRGKDMLADHFDHHAELYAALDAKGKEEERARLEAMQIPSGRLSVVRQDQPLGLGHAVGCAAALVGDEPFAVLLPDEIFLPRPGGKGCLAQMVAAYAQTGGNLIAVEEVPRSETSRYGIVDTDAQTGSIVPVHGLVEKPDPVQAPSTLAITGRYILQPEIFAHLAKGQRGAGGEIQLTDAMAMMIGEAPFHAIRCEGKRHDCGHALGLLTGSIAKALAHPEYGTQLRSLLNDILAEDKAA